MINIDNRSLVNLQEAQDFITALTGSPDTPMAFRTISEKPGVSTPTLNTFGTLADSKVILESANSQGSCVSVTVQTLDGKGKSNQNVTKIRALFVDFDGKLPSPTEWHLQPSIVVENANGKGHAYWVLESLADPYECKIWLQRLVAHYNDFGADSACIDLARVLRVPGFLHLKGIPTRSILQYCGTERYTPDQVLQGVSLQTIPYSVALGKEIAKMRSGTTGRNNALNRATFTLVGMYPERAEEIKEALGQVAADLGLDDTEIDVCLQKASKAGKEKPLAPVDPDSDDLIKTTQMDAAWILATAVFQDILYDTESSQWYEYNGKGKWDIVKHDRIFRKAQYHLAQEYEIPTPAYLNGCITFAQSYVGVDGWSEMSSLLYLPFANGVLDLKANVFLPHSKDYGFTWQLPREYSATLAPYPAIDSFLNVLTQNDQELKDLAIAYCAAVLLGMSDLQRCLYLYGSGANGKGAFMILLQMLVGHENVHGTNMTELNNNRFESANLKGKRLVVMSDEDKYSGKLTTFKAATGGDPVRFERKGCDASSFFFTGMIIIAANKPTFLGNGDGGISRRIISYPCKAVIDKMDRVNQAPLFEGDLTAFTAHLLSLDPQWIHRQIHNAEGLKLVKELKEELAIRGNSVAAFYHDALEPSAEGRCTGLYALYKQYCQENGVTPKSSKNFTPDLIEYCNVTQGIYVHKKKSMGLMTIYGLMSQSLV